MISIGLLLHGLMLGALYGLFGLGLSFAFGIMRIVNIAHGDLIVLAAYLGATLIAHLHLPIAAVVPIVLVAAFGTGWLLQSALLNRLVGPNPVPAMIATMGLSILLRNGLVKVFGAGIRSIHVGSIQYRSVSILGTSIGVFPLIIFGCAIAAFAAMHLLLHRTTLGRAFRAAADDHEILETLGFNRRRVYSAAMGLAVALSALSGLLLAMQSSFSPYSGVERLLLSFEVVIIGGLGSLGGTLGAGLFLGLVQVVGLGFDSDAGPIFQHAAFFVVLLARQIRVPRALVWRRR